MRVSSILRQSAEKFPTSPFIRIENETIGYHEALINVSSYKQWIEENVSKSRIETDEHTHIVVAFLSHNSPELLLCLIGSIDACHLMSGKNVTVESAMINARWSPKEIACALGVTKNHNVDASAARQYLTVILASEEMMDIAKSASKMLNEASSYHRACSCLIPSLNMIHRFIPTQLQDGEGLYQTSSLYSDSIIIFTSGTTSGPKGVRLSHLSLLIQGMAKNLAPCFYDSKTRVLASTVPFFHIGGLSTAISVIIAGGTLIFSANHHGNNGFSPSNVLDNMNDENESIAVDTNTLVLVPAMLHALLAVIKSESSAKKIYKGVRLLLIGGQSITDKQLKEAIQIFPNARIVQTFACTEAGSSITFDVKFDPDNLGRPNPNVASHRSRVGFPPPHVELKIFELDGANRPTNIPAALGKIGAIGTRGPHVMNGYWNRSDIKCTNLDPNEKWLIMNDLGYLDEASGALFFCGRANDVIRSGGETIYAPEVENLLIEHPQIDQCAVFGLNDDKFGEVVCAAIVALDSHHDIQNAYPSDKWLKILKEYCTSRQLSSYKRPKFVFCYNELPRNSSGKVLKHILQQQCTNARHEHIQRQLQSRL
jgi:acyl-CoA synthetase (AMP-forming)/AMP-acid ligase II